MLSSVASPLVPVIHLLSHRCGIPSSTVATSSSSWGSSRFTLDSFTTISSPSLSPSESQGWSCSISVITSWTHVLSFIPAGICPHPEPTSETIILILPQRNWIVTDFSFPYFLGVDPVSWIKCYCIPRCLMIGYHCVVVCAAVVNHHLHSMLDVYDC